MKTYERRMAVGALEFREDSTAPILTGYASTFDQPYDMGWYTETVAPTAFQRTLNASPDVRLLINHGGLPLARTTSGTLTLDTDSRGLRVSAQLDPSDPDVQSLIPKMRRGDLNQMSFGFRTIDDEWSNDMSKRTMRALDLSDGDVSVVTYPANPNAAATIRALGGTRTDAITSALAALETRNASDQDVVAVLSRALAAFRSDPADIPPTTIPDECGCCTDQCSCGDCADCSLFDVEPSAQRSDETSEATRVALAALEIRKARLRLL